ncbi:hypothetical protein A3K01_01805 [candidate division WWE3 bacterium RIFOXYD1_FULL_43_17]|uniref:Type 4 fimbrial biogenesis protein PilX N-terminal domain-containing protein n=3 Tax=Katanobacteria TaxID=422282 RepID=A0A1F4XBH1_UNCKA|nr:MAG: hypothetical protein UU59_C0011G0012 [candidate division WWE3 bacterium GW2011_GWE1_41_27]KKS60317.1 MAG: hypothetical protein UV26_C0005G0005 [candidate division WWE3 bacterium GW2011_GWF2_42_42]OGC79026.1 MAG: hypothetical protein A3K01_01805 [candidate division WWE3 bacterium RIFOXYD1_FULL_43_17]
MNRRFKELNNNGQALLFVVVAMTIALSVGVAISSRTLQMSSRVSRTDTSARVLAAAEGGIDRLLDQPTVLLDRLAAKTQDCTELGFTSVTGDLTRCILNFQKAPSDPIESRAILSARTFNHTDIMGSTGYYATNLLPGQSKNIELTGMNNIRICWQNSSAAIEYILYGPVTTERNFLKASGGVTFSSDISSTGFSDASSEAIREGYPMPNCYNVAVTGMTGVRIRSIFQNSEVAIVPVDPTSLPVQGYRLYSRGELVQEDDVKTTKAIVVYRSYSSAPAFFDYAIFSNGDTP